LYEKVKELYDAHPAKNRVDGVTAALFEDKPCGCILRKEQVKSIVQLYQKITQQKFSVKDLVKYVLESFGVKVNGLKDKLLRVAMTGMTE
jgi:hypothetical protein